jgi:hypothetical protein
MRPGVVLLLLGVLTVGCGSSTAGGAKGLGVTASHQLRCQATTARDTFACGYPLQESRQSSIWIGSAGRRLRVTGPARVALAGIPAQPIKNARPAGFWVHERIFVSPDGRTLLAQWSGECEGQSTYLVATSGGRPRSIFISESSALGWSKDGRARVFLAEPGFGSERGYRPGKYLVDPQTMKRTLVQPARSRLGC